MADRLMSVEENAKCCSYCQLIALCGVLFFCVFFLSSSCVLSSQCFHFLWWFHSMSIPSVFASVSAIFRLDFGIVQTVLVFVSFDYISKLPFASFKTVPLFSYTYKKKTYLKIKDNTLFQIMLPNA